MRKLIAILEPDFACVQEMVAWLDDRLYMYGQAIGSDAKTLIGEIGSRLKDVLILCLAHDHSDPQDSSELLASLLMNQAVRFPILTYSRSGSMMAGGIRDLASKGWDIRAIGPIQEKNWVGAVWYPALKRSLRQYATNASVTAAEGPDLIHPGVESSG